MALIKCKECGAQISTTAKACPKCGASPPRQTSGCAWIALLFVGIPMIAGIIYQGAVTPEREAAAAVKEAKRVALLSPAQKASELQAARIYSAKGACRIYVKESLKDPNSAEFMGYGKTSSSDDGGVVSVSVSYRAKNSFGALVPAAFSCTVKLSGESWLPVEIKEAQ